MPSRVLLKRQSISTGKLLSVNPDDLEVRARYDTLLDSLSKEPEPQDIELVAGAGGLSGA